MSFNRAAIAAVSLAGLALGGCTHVNSALGLGSATPDEFRVVARAPLVVPPDYSLRPPAPGEPRPQELQPESAARTAMLGERMAESRDDGEKIFASQAGADKADPLVRFTVDDEFGELAHKDKSFADKVMFWHSDAAAKTPAEAKLASAADNPAPVDPTAPGVKALTGDQPVIIARDKRGSFIKLPGL